VALLALAGGAAAYTGIAVTLFRHAVAAPYLTPLLGAVLVLAIVVAYRFIVAEKDKRLLRKNFGLYLAPSVVDELIRAETPPELGGEQRIVSVYCSDVAGFSTFSETMTPQELVELMNEYLSAMTDVIEAHNGYVDNYIGDAIIAIFGAPMDDPDHARHAVQAALACRKKLDEMNLDPPAAFRGRRLTQRIGLNCGEALVGNIGSRRRLKYTVMGDTINLAARLESANKIYGTRILASEEVKVRAGEGLRWREVDRVRVVGRKRPVTILEPLLADDPVPVGHFAEALAEYRAARFREAAERFAALAATDPPATTWAARARQLAEAPPGAGWDPVTTLETK
jgi:class 3 adenylate cyclase